MEKLYKLLFGQRSEEDTQKLSFKEYSRPADTLEQFEKTKKYAPDLNELESIWNYASNSLAKQNEREKQFKPIDITGKSPLIAKLLGLKLPNTKKLNIKQDWNSELISFQITRKQKQRSIQDVWQRIKYLSKGLTLHEWAERVEPGWENMLEYTEKIYENFFLFSMRHTYSYYYLQKVWSD